MAIRPDAALRAWLVPSAILFFASVVHGQDLLNPLWHGTSYDYQIRYPYLLEQFKQQFEAGVFYPRWLYHLNGGYGYPTFLLYQPGYWFFALPFSYLRENPADAAKLAHFAVTALWLSALYRITRLFGAQRVLALSLLPLFAVMTYVKQTSVGPAMAAAIWGIYFALLLQAKAGSEARRKPLVGFLLATTAAIYCHPIVSALYLPIVLALSLGYGMQAPRPLKREYGSALIYALVVAFAFSAPYWLTAHALKPLVMHETATEGIFNPVYNFTHHGAGRLGFLPQYYCGGQLHWSTLGTALALASFFLLRKDWRFRWLFMAYATIFFMVSGFSLPLWERFDGLDYVQFPVRLFGALEVIEPFAIAAAAGRLSHHLKPWACVAFFVSVGLGAFFTHRPLHWIPRLVPVCNAADTLVPLEYEPYKQSLEARGFLTFQASNELLPRAAQMDRLLDRNIHPIPAVQPAGEGVEVTLLSGDSAPWFPIRAEVKVARENAAIFINQLYFPGWSVKVNGAETKPHMEESGIMRLEFARLGTYTVEAVYEGAPASKARNALIIGVALSATLLYALTTRKRRRHYASSPSAAW